MTSKKKFFVALFIILSVFFIYGKAHAAKEGYTIETVEDLYKLCKQAQEEYKGKPEEIGNSVCGAYVQGQILGFGIGQIQTLTFIRGGDLQFKIIEGLRSRFCNTPETINEYIEQFVVWAENNSSYFNGISYGGFWESVSNNCNKQKGKK